jgi:hypothetical protein
MLGNSDFRSSEERGPARFPKPSIEYASADPSEQPPIISQIYAAAWAMAQRDHELDMLFNADYYRGRDI